MGGSNILSLLFEINADSSRAETAMSRLNASSVASAANIRSVIVRLTVVSDIKDLLTKNNRTQTLAATVELRNFGS